MRPFATKPVKPILRTPSKPVLGRRTSQDAGLDPDPSTSASVAKRRKVLFDEFQNTTHHPALGRTKAEIRKQVRSALEAHIAGLSGQYDNIKEMFTRDTRSHLSPTDPEDEDDDDDDDDEDETDAEDHKDAVTWARPRPKSRQKQKQQQLRDYVAGLSCHMPLLKNKACNGLTKAVLACSWLGRSEDFVRVYIQFLAALVTAAQGSYLHAVLAMVVEKFGIAKPADAAVAGLPRVPRDVMRGRIHSALRHLLKIVPAATEVLPSILSSKFPFPHDTVAVHMAFVTNLIRLSRYAPAIETAILDLIVHRLVRLDVQMQTDLEDLDEELGTAFTQNLRSVKVEDGSGDWEDADPDDDDDGDELARLRAGHDGTDWAQDPEVARLRSIKGTVRKLDFILDTLFAFYAPHFADPDSDEAFDYYRILLDEFQNIILPTRNSRHTQFLLFHFGQKSDRLLDALIGTCVTTAFQSTKPPVLKQAATLYLSSFVSRAAHLSAPLARAIFATLLHHLDAYCRSHERTCRGPDLKRYYGYYTLFQGIIYMFCFRWRDLVTAAPDLVHPDDPASYVGQELEWLPSCKEVLLGSIHSKMNPLKVCSPSIVDEFARLAHRLNFVYIFPRVQSNKRLRLSQFLSDTYGNGGALRDSGAAHLDEDSYQLDSWFPFDPYQLPTSKRWLESDYVSWTEIPGLTADDDGNDGDDSEPDDPPDCGRARDSGMAGIHDAELVEDTATESSGDGEE